MECIKKPFIELPFSVPLAEDDAITKDHKAFIWCLNHDSPGKFKVTHIERATNWYSTVWFELDKDAVIFKLKFA